MEAARLSDMSNVRTGPVPVVHQTERSWGLSQ